MRKVALLKWLADYITAIEKVDADCEQKLVLPELREVKNLLSIYVRPIPEIPGDIQVSDFVPEFIDKLIDQLKFDHNRWGNTWLNRPKEGQELRTKARFIDYFDMFENAGTFVPWMKIVGGALICWIRDNHPELCPGVSEVIAKDMKEMGFEEFKVNEPEVIGVKVSPDGKEGKEFSKGLQETTDKAIVEAMKNSPRPNPVAHVCNERIESIGQGALEYLPRNSKNGKIILESIQFTNGVGPDAPVLGRCNKVGLIIPTSKVVGVLGRVSSNGQYRLTGAMGVGFKDTIYVFYDYEFDHLVE